MIKGLAKDVLQLKRSQTKLARENRTSAQDGGQKNKRKLQSGRYVSLYIVTIATVMTFGCFVQLLKTTQADSDQTWKLWNGSKAEKLEKAINMRSR